MWQTNPMVSSSHGAYEDYDFYVKIHSLILIIYRKVFVTLRLTNFIQYNTRPLNLVNLKLMHVSPLSEHSKRRIKETDQSDLSSQQIPE